MKFLFTFAEQRNLITKHPMRFIKAPKSDFRTVDYMPLDEARFFLEALKEAPLRWQTAMQILIFVGLRRGELIGLQWQDIDFQKGTLSIQRNVTYSGGGQVTVSSPKSDSSYRVLPIPVSVLSLLSQWKIEQQEYFISQSTESTRFAVTPNAFVFSSESTPFEPMFPTVVTRWLSRFCARNGLPSWSPHDLRHTCGSLMLEGGASVKQTQLFLGHSQPTTTLKFYCGTDQEGLRRAGNMLADSLIEKHG